MFSLPWIRLKYYTEGGKNAFGIGQQASKQAGKRESRQGFLYLPLFTISRIQWDICQISSSSRQQLKCSVIFDLLEPEPGKLLAHKSRWALLYKRWKHADKELIWCTLLHRQTCLTFRQVAALAVRLADKLDRDEWSEGQYSLAYTTLSRFLLKYRHCRPEAQKVVTTFSSLFLSLCQPGGRKISCYIVFWPVIELPCIASWQSFDWSDRKPAYISVCSTTLHTL